MKNTANGNEQRAKMMVSQMRSLASRFFSSFSRLPVADDSEQIVFVKYKPRMISK